MSFHSSEEWRTTLTMVPERAETVLKKSLQKMQRVHHQRSKILLFTLRWIGFLRCYGVSKSADNFSLRKYLNSDRLPFGSLKAKSSSGFFSYPIRNEFTHIHREFFSILRIEFQIYLNVDRAIYNHLFEIKWVSDFDLLVIFRKSTHSSIGEGQLTWVKV